jgi:3',5'-cyclic-AMP phosphodiesterase
MTPVSDLIAQISDPHVGVGAGDSGACRRLEGVVAAVAALEPTPDAVLLTGDVAANGAPAEYARVQELLAPLREPIHAMPGNHDNRDALREAFLPQLAPDTRYLQYAVMCGGLRVVVCDTIEPGQDGGDLGGGRLQWIEAALAADRSTPTVLAMHHPPLATGIPLMDAIGLAAPARAALAGVVGAAPNVIRIVAGHVHRAMVASLGECPVFACPSSDIAVGLDLAGGELRMVDEPPAFALHIAAADGLTSLVQPVA